MKDIITLRAVRAYLWRILVSLNQTYLNVVPGPLWNAITLIESWLCKTDKSQLHKYGFPDETLSSVFFKNRELSPIARWFDGWLDKIDPGHGRDAYEPDEGRNFRG